MKRLQAQHRLVLSGTPIQNSALELWSLFDFLMPGFLGGEVPHIWPSRVAGAACCEWVPLMHASCMHSRFVQHVWCGQIVQVMACGAAGLVPSRLVLQMHNSPDWVCRAVLCCSLLCVPAAERDFQARFGKLVAAARYSKKDSKEAEAGMLALDALHKQVMPFILRRTKAQVLQDLPPKIITDVMCSLSPIQHALYEDFQESQALSEVRSTLAAAVAAEGGSGSNGSDSGSRGAQHVFSTLLYLRKLCSHPLLVLDWSVPAHRDACQHVLGVNTQAAAEQALRALEHAPKLLALQDILVQCGIVSTGLAGSGFSAGAAAAGAGESDLSDGSSDSGHRLLVFAQLKGMLDLVESLLLQPLGVSSLRLDGSVDASARFGVVQRFNTDPTIQVRLFLVLVALERWRYLQACCSSLCCLATLRTGVQAHRTWPSLHAAYSNAQRRGIV